MAYSGVSRLFKPLIQLVLSVLHIDTCTQMAGHGVKSTDRARLAICVLFTEAETAHAVGLGVGEAEGLTPARTCK